jgi:hypothetical protein
MNTRLLRAHWFYFLVPALLAVETYLIFSTQLKFDRPLEAGLLFDLAVLTPLLYWLCYRSRGRKAAFRAVALACLGVWIAAKLVPEPDHDLLTYAMPLRYAGLAVLVWIELAIGFAIYRTIFRGGSVSEVTAQLPMEVPSWVVKLIAIEVHFWQKVSRAIKRLLKRR